MTYSITTPIAAGLLAGLGFLTPAQLTPAVAAYQSCCGIRPAAGVLGPITRRSLQLEDAFQDRIGTKNYRGAVGHILQLEGLVGRPYWPGFNSGVTLDPGFDLGVNDLRTFRALYGAYLPRSAMAALENAIGLRGPEAKAWLDENGPALFALSPHASAAEMPELSASVIAEWWRRLVKAEPWVESSPPTAQMALLSLYFNRGGRAVDQIADLARIGEWPAVAAAIAQMNATNPGLSARRKFEAGLIRQAAGVNP